MTELVIQIIMFYKLSYNIVKYSFLIKLGLIFALLVLLESLIDFPLLPLIFFYSFPLELVHSDRRGPSHVASTNGFLYYITFVDAFSRFTWIYLLKSKAEIFIVFKKFKAMVKLQFNTKIKNL